MLRVLIVGLVVLVAAMFLLPRPGSSPPANATVLPEPRALPAVELVDATGKRANLDEVLRGRFSLLFFGFTNCPDVCPLTLKVLADARAGLATRFPNAVPQVVFVSVDAARDTPEKIAAYLQNFDAAFVGATSDGARLAPLLKTLGVSVQKHEHGGENYTVVHNSAVYVIGPEAEWIAVSSGPHDAAVIAADYLKIRQRYQAAHRTPGA
jgi:cytochrome oxidase Cu insertion factor (SCO1/SenC/PrrC family)